MVDGRFYVTLTAVEQYARLEGLDPDTDDGFESAEDELLQRLETAGHVRDQNNGLQEWRLKQDAHLGRGKRPRYRVLVSTAKHAGGDLPQVVQVLSEHHRRTR